MSTNTSLAPSTAAVLDQLEQQHQQLLDYVDHLSDEELLVHPPGKWNGGQHLQHVYLCLRALGQALLSKTYLLNSFGVIDRPVKSAEAIRSWYAEGIAAGGKSPERYEPGPYEPGSKTSVVAELQQALLRVRTLLADYSEEELDTLVLPHPFLGSLTIREFLYLMAEHPLVHLRAIERGLR